MRRSNLSDQWRRRKLHEMPLRSKKSFWSNCSMFNSVRLSNDSREVGRDLVKKARRSSPRRGVDKSVIKRLAPSAARLRRLRKRR
ncbi:hypothetical protein EVAR_64520_1 [Eumeta japonica]|uniref:Uncharacterized protein n=1 Tax=Eumeta variegata TaxID=151549 RepID=A0A4C1ZHY1_EUMVA|nr:hypothetical protein EVAR_64520_1 [Eumeta japonica]